MKTITQRLLALFLCILMAATLLPMSAFADDNKNGDYKLVALTFDDGPSRYTPKLLDAMKERGVKATFFIVGNRISSFPETVERMVAEGHQLANHSWDHSYFNKLSSSQIKDQIRKTNNALNDRGGSGSYYVRSPGGFLGSTIRDAVGAPLIQWSVDPEDWKYRDTAKVSSSILNSVQDGDIVLLHDLYSTSVDAAIIVMDSLLDQGYELVTVQELFRRRGITAENGSVYYKARNTGINLGPLTEPTEEEPDIIEPAPEEPPVDPQAFDESRLNEHWAYESIQFVRDKGIFKGDGDGSFGPNRYMTRGMFVTVLGRAADVDPGAFLQSDFVDVPASQYYSPYVSWATEVGIVTGYTDGHFGPDEYISREQMAVIMARYLDYYGTGDENPAVPPEDENTGEDAETPPEEQNDETDAGTLPEEQSGGSDTETPPETDSGSADPAGELATQDTAQDGGDAASPPTAESKYADFDSISDWAIDGVLKCTECGLLTGDNTGCFNPHGTSTRAMCAVVIARLMTLADA